MALELPHGIAKYFAADKERDAHAVSECFTDSAVVKDEKNTYRGRDAIRRWKSESSQKYTYTVDPFSMTTEGDLTIVTSHLVGNFPGSPIDLRYLFVLDDEKIATLEILL